MVWPPATIQGMNLDDAGHATGEEKNFTRLRLKKPREQSAQNFPESQNSRPGIVTLSWTPLWRGLVTTQRFRWCP